MVIINDEMLHDNKVILDEGFYFGRGVFETILLENNNPILLPYHLERLNEGLRVLGIGKDIKEDYVLYNIKKAGYKNCALKIMVSEKNTIFSTRDIPYREEDYIKGFSLNVSKVLRNETSLSTYIKGFDYYENIIEKRKSKEFGFHEPLFLNSKKQVAECATSNIFFINKEKVCTPKINCGILNGTIRKVLLEKLGSYYELEEGYYNLEELYNSQGVFISNSLLGIMKVNKINEIKINENKNIDIIRELYEKNFKYTSNFNLGVEKNGR